MKAYRFDTEWFELQFGKRPKRSLCDISDEINICECKLSYLRKELLEWEIYHAKEDAALKTFVKTVFDLKEKK